MIDNFSIKVLIVLINILLILYLVFFSRKNYRFLIYWILFFIACPVISWILFFIYRYLLSYYLRKYDSIFFLLNSKIDELIKKNISFPEVNERNVNLIENISFSKLTLNNNPYIYNSIKEYYSSLFNEIEKAKKSIYISMYIIENDELGNKLFSLLIKKANEGVKVILLFDRIGSYKIPLKKIKELKKNKVEVLSYFSMSPFQLLFNLNIRNHRKIILIDAKKAFVGGVNIGEEYLSKHTRIKPWQDLQILLEGDCNLYLMKQFYLDYYFSLFCHKKITRIKIDENDFSSLNCKMKTYAQMISSSYINEEVIFEGVLSVLSSTKRTLYIETPYLIPNSSIYQMLKCLLKSNVKVYIVIPLLFDQLIPYRVSEFYASLLEELGANIYLYEGFIHSKCIVSDEKISIVGSLNFDNRSLKYNMETGIVFYDKEVSKKIIERIKKDAKSSVFFSKEKYDGCSIIIKIQRRLFFLFSQIM